MAGADPKETPGSAWPVPPQTIEEFAAELARVSAQYDEDLQRLIAAAMMLPVPDGLQIHLNAVQSSLRHAKRELDTARRKMRANPET